MQAASSQKLGYNYGSCIKTFKVNDPVWLLFPHQEKPGSKWQGGWTCSEGIKGYSYIEISNEKGHCKIELYTAPHSTTRHFKYS